MNLPSGFSQMIRELLKGEADDFFRAMAENPVVSVRLNKRKKGAEFPGSEPVKWCSSGIYLSERPDFTHDPLLHAGAYYVQDASSMIYETVTEKLRKELVGDRIDVPLSVIDLCAAPGGKTTAMINALHDGCHVLANEYVTKRVGALRENISKWGYPNVTITNRDTSFFREAGMSFDIVAVDAPCSGEGMMRKDEMACKQWSTSLIAQCALLQKEILTNANAILKPGGFLIYSTCTFNRIENEDNVLFVRDKIGLTPIDLRFQEDWGIDHGIDIDVPSYRFMPHKTKGEGLFLSVFRKGGEWQSSPIISLPAQKVKNRQTKRNLKKDQHVISDVISIEEILSTNFCRTIYREVELNLEQALSFLHREALVLPPSVPVGLTIVTYKGLPLGMVKNIGSRANNLYPKNWRILK